MRVIAIELVFELNSKGRNRRMRRISEMVVVKIKVTEEFSLSLGLFIKDSAPPKPNCQNLSRGE